MKKKWFYQPHSTNTHWKHSQIKFLSVTLWKIRFSIGRCESLTLNLIRNGSALFTSDILSVIKKKLSAWEKFVFSKNIIRPKWYFSYRKWNVLDAISNKNTECRVDLWQFALRSLHILVRMEHTFNSSWSSGTLRRRFFQTKISMENFSSKWKKEEQMLSAFGRAKKFFRLFDIFLYKKNDVLPVRR